MVSPVWMTIAGLLTSAVVKGEGQEQAILNLANDFVASPDYNANIGARRLQIETDPNVGAFSNLMKGYIVVENGVKVAEWYKSDNLEEGETPMSSTTASSTFSINKSFTGLCFGIMEKQGLISLTETLTDIWPADNEVWSKVTGNVDLKQQVTIEELLTHTSGFDDPPFSSLDFLNLGGANFTDTLDFLAYQGDGSTGNFAYLGFANVLSYVVLERTGKSVQDYMAEEYFSYLGMSETDFWATNQDGEGYTRNGLSLTVPEMAKWGQTYLQNGYVNPDTLLVAPDFVQRATTPTVTIPASSVLYPSLSAISTDLSYGYMVSIYDESYYCAYGASGQFICVWPEHNRVAACQVAGGGMSDNSMIGVAFINMVNDWALNDVIVDLTADLWPATHYNRNDGAKELQQTAENTTSAFRNVMKGYMVLESGRKVAEWYKTENLAEGETAMSPTTISDTFSVTKSFTALCFGMMEKFGYITMDERLVDIWPASHEAWSGVAEHVELKQNITIQELLTHSSGFDNPTDVAAYDMNNLGGADLVGTLDFLSFVAEDAKGSFRYLAAANVLGYVVLERTSQPIQEFMQGQYLSYLGMSPGEGGNYAWAANEAGQGYVSTGLSISVPQMAKFGQTYLQGGYINNEILRVAPDWVKRATMPRVPIPPTDLLFPTLGLIDPNVKYGYMMSILDGDTDGEFYCALGASGQFICMWPGKKRVAVCQIIPSLDLLAGENNLIGAEFINMVNDLSFDNPKDSNANSTTSTATNATDNQISDNGTTTGGEDTVQSASGDDSSAGYSFVDTNCVKRWITSVGSAVIMTSFYLS